MRGASRFSKADRQRFWQRVQRNGPDECWPFIGRDGQPVKHYGQMRFDGQLYRASHIMLMLTSRRRTKNGFALHSCDNPVCVNPAHLRWGTAAMNAQDRVERGRHGRRKPRTILSAEQKAAILAAPLDEAALRAMGLWGWQIEELAAEQLDQRAARLAGGV